MEITTSNTEFSSQQQHNHYLNALSSLDYAIHYAVGAMTYECINNDKMVSKSYKEHLDKYAKKVDIFNYSNEKSVSELIVSTKKKITHILGLTSSKLIEDEKMIREYCDAALNSLDNCLSELLVVKRIKNQEEIAKKDKVKSSFYRDDWKID